MSVPCKDGVKVQAGRLTFLQTQSYWLKNDKWFSSWETVVGLFFMLKSVVKKKILIKGKVGEEKSLSVVQNVQNLSLSFFYLKLLKSLYRI